MKTKLFSMCAIAAVLLSSCMKEEQFTGGADGNGLVSFELNLVDGAQTRAISDGAKVDKLVYAVYDENGILLNAADDLTTPEVESQVVKVYENGLLGRNEKVNCKLVKGHTYQILFWAQDNDCTAYDTDNLTNVVVDYNDVNNSDLRDAFAGYVKLIVEGDQTVQVTMTRPFAQVNVGTTVADWEAAVKAGVTIATSKVEMTGVANTINLLTGQVGGVDGNAVVDVTLAAAAIPAAAETGEEVLTVKKADGTTAAYKYLSMSYVLAGNIAPADVTSAVIPSMKYSFYEETVVTDNAVPAFVIEKGLSSIPVKANWRTNIIGDLFTNDVAFEIIVAPVYETPDNIIEYPFVLKAGDLAGEDGEISEEMEETLLRVVDNGTLALEGEGTEGDVAALGEWLQGVDGSVIQTLDLTKYEIEEIPASAFYATELAEVKLSSTVKTIGANAFQYSDVEYVEMPGVTEIGANAFANAFSNLETVVLSETDMVAIGEKAFDGCENLTTIINIENIESIGMRAFQGVSSIEVLDLANCKSIGQYAFNRCNNLTEVNLPSIETIGSNAFYGLDNLTTVNLPVDSDVDIAGSAFKGCSGLATINLGNLTVISSYAFQNCTKLNNVDLSNVITVKNGAFSGCSALTSVSLPKVTSIDFYAFQNCTSLSEVRVESKSDITLGSGGMYPFSKLPENAVLYLHNEGLTKNTVSGTTWANYTWSAIKYVDDSGNVVE